MFPIQPPLIPSFFSFKKIANQEKFHKQFFLSWEDSLWHLLRIHQFTEGSIVLIPEFFCWDVVQNMTNHGLTSKTYKVDKYLQADINDFCNQIKKYQPAIVIIFHALGISNLLFERKDEWLKLLPKNSIIIEDCVHRVIDIRKINFISNNHYIIDSLRKVLPVQGSWLYSKNIIKKNSKTNFFLTRWYTTQVIFWWILMQFFLVLNYYSKTFSIKKITNILAEKSMEIGYDIIGDFKLPADGNFIMAGLSQFVNIDNIYENKRIQAKFYSHNLSNFFANTKMFYEIPIHKDDYHNLRGYPLGIEIAVADDFLNFVRNKGLILRFELDDSPWSEKQKVVYLPMGVYVQQKNLVWVVKILDDCLINQKSIKSK